MKIFLKFMYNNTSIISFLSNCELQKKKKKNDPKHIRSDTNSIKICLGSIT